MPPIMASESLTGEPSAVSRPEVGSAGMYVTLLAVFVLTYGLTAQRGPAWQDSGILQWRILQGDPGGWMGVALAHPLLVALGGLARMIPCGTFAWRVNMVCALAGAVAVANVAALIRRLAPGRPMAAWAGAGFFGLAHTTWWLATICESQTLLVALFTFELHVLVWLVRRPRQRLVVLLGLTNGLALTAHNLALLALPAYGLTVLHMSRRRGLPWWCLLWLIAGWAVGASGFLVLVAGEAGKTGLASAIHSGLFGQRWQGAVLVGSIASVGSGVGYILYNFPNLTLPLAIAGLVLIGKRLPRQLAWPARYLLAVYLLFAVRYDVPDQFMFFLPFYAMTSVLAGAGLAWLSRSDKRRWLAPAAAVSLLITPMIYAAAPKLWQAFSLPLPGRKDLPGRNPARYWLVPWKGREDSAERFARTALEQVPPGSVIIADSTSRPPLQLTQACHRIGLDVELPTDGRAARKRAPVGTPNVFVVSAKKHYCPTWILRAARLRKDSDDAVLFRVVWHGQPTPAAP